MMKELFAFTVRVLFSIILALSSAIMPMSHQIHLLLQRLWQRISQYIRTSPTLMSMVQHRCECQLQYQHQRRCQLQLQNMFKKNDNPAVALTRKAFVENLSPKLSASKGLTEKLTSELKGMFTDLITSQDTILGFHAAEGAEIADGLTVQVLDTGSWPTQSVATCTLPPEILRVYDKFKTHYLGRMLWHTNVGTTDMKATSEKGKQYTNFENRKAHDISENPPASLLFNKAPLKCQSAPIHGREVHHQQYKELKEHCDRTSRQRPKHLGGLLASSRVFRVLVGRGISSALQIVLL